MKTISATVALRHNYAKVHDYLYIDIANLQKLVTTRNLHEKLRVDGILDVYTGL